MQLAHVMLLRLRATPNTIDELTSWIRHRWPRILPDAIGTTLLRLKNRGLVQVSESVWNACQLPTLHLPRRQ